MVSVVRHASGVEDSFLSWPPKGVEELFSNPILHHVFTPNKERERERNKERGIRSRRNLTTGAFVSSDMTRVCVYILRAGKICPNFCGEEEKRRRQNFSKSIFLGASLLLHEFCISLSVSLSLCECMFYYEGVVKCHVRIANRLGEDSYCRGGIVNTRFGISLALLVRRNRSTALWRFRASTSNSLSGRTWPQTDTHVR